jgi:hypothetical protein
MSKEVKIVVKAYNQTKRAFAEVGRGITDLSKGNFGAGFAHMGAAVKQFGATSGMVLAKVGAMAKRAAMGVMAAGVAVVAVGKKAIDAYKAQAQATAKLDQALKNSAYAAGYTTSELEDMATALMKTTGVQDEVTQSVMAFLAASGKIRGDTFKRATEAALDMGAAFKKAGDDSAAVEEKSQLLAKALEDPAEGLTKLSRAGVRFTNEQEAMIKAMAEAGDVAGAQGMILAEVERRYKGTAAQAHEATKAQDELAISFGELQEQLGEIISKNDTFKGAMGDLSKVIDDLSKSGKIELWAENFAAGLSMIGEAVKPLLSLVGSLGGKLMDAGQSIAAFAMADGGLGARWTAAKNAPAANAAVQASELAAIQKRKDDEKAAKAEADKADMEKAKPDLAARDAADAKAKAASKEAAEAKRENAEWMDDELARFKRIEEAEKKRVDSMIERERLAKELYDVEKEIAKEQAAQDADAREDNAKRWADELEKAQDAAEKIRDALDLRTNQGAVGSPEWRASMKEGDKIAHRLERIQKKRAAMGLEKLEGAEKWGADEMGDQERVLRIAGKLERGIRLSKADKEALKRDGLRNAGIAAAAAVKVAEDNVKAGQAARDLADEKQWRADMILTLMNQADDLQTLLRASN